MSDMSDMSDMNDMSDRRGRSECAAGDRYGAINQPRRSATC